MSESRQCSASERPLAPGTGSAFHERDVALRGVTLHVATGPQNGDPLLCIHGVGRAWRDAVPLLGDLVPRWSLTLPDLRGHGGSARTPGEYQVRNYLADIVALLERFDKPVVIYGHSLGALLAALAADACPQRVRAIIAEDPPSPAFLEKLPQTAYDPIFRAMQRLAGSDRPIAELARELGDTVIRQGTGGPVRFRDIRDATAVRFSARWLRNLDPTVYTPVLERHWEDGLDFPAVWSRITCPVLLLAGDESAGGMLPAADVEDIASRLADGTVVNFPRIGHQIHWMAQEATVRVLLAFLETL